MVKYKSQMISKPNILPTYFNFDGSSVFILHKNACSSILLFPFIDIGMQILKLFGDNRSYVFFGVQLRLYVFFKCEFKEEL